MTSELTGVAHGEQLLGVLAVALASGDLGHGQLQIERRVTKRLDAAVAPCALSHSLGEELDACGARQ